MMSGVADLVHVAGRREVRDEEDPLDWRHSRPKPALGLCTRCCCSPLE